jgi:hypothetical protein
MNITFDKKELDVIYGALRAKLKALDKLQELAENNGMQTMVEAAIEQRKTIVELIMKLCTQRN